MGEDTHVHNVRARNELHIPKAAQELRTAYVSIRQHTSAYVSISKAAQEL